MPLKFDLYECGDVIKKLSTTLRKKLRRIVILRKGLKFQLLNKIEHGFSAAINAAEIAKLPTLILFLESVIYIMSHR